MCFYSEGTLRFFRFFYFVPKHQVYFFLHFAVLPVSVEIKGPRGPLSADMSAQVVCQVNGSRPEAFIRWFLGPYQLNDTETHVMSPNTTLGVLYFVPTDRDHGAKLRCIASNSLASKSFAPLQDSWILDVHCKCFLSTAVL